MGSKSSKLSEYKLKQQEINLEEIAARNYHKRMDEYNYAHHGYYIDYIEWCRAQYELECIPECCRRGSTVGDDYVIKFN